MVCRFYLRKLKLYPYYLESEAMKYFVIQQKWY